MSYDSMTSTNLLMVGIQIDKNIVYSPDWPFFIGVLIAVLALIVLSVVTIGYVYRKSWKLKPYQHIDYQDQNYTAIKIEDPEDTENALISLNADAQSFQFLNSGKEILRTREQMKAKRAQKKKDKDRKKKEKKQKQLELEQVEDLKDRLNKHLKEIKKLFGEDNNGAQNNEDDDENDDDSQKLVEQIQRLREIIEENRKVLEGEDLEEVTAEDLQRQAQEQKEQEEVERKAKEEELQKIKELEFNRMQEDKQQKNMEELDKKKD